MDKNRKGVVSYHQLCELVFNREAAYQVRTRHSLGRLKRALYPPPPPRCSLSLLNDSDTR